MRLKIMMFWNIHTKGSDDNTQSEHLHTHKKKTFKVDLIDISKCKFVPTT